jgi:tricorn protease
MARQSFAAVCLTVLVWLASGPAFRAASPIRLARYPDYHAGKIAFSYLGDIWVVNEDGANAQRITDNLGRDTYPRFSPDGRLIAFSSSRHGNNDVFVVSTTGGAPKRLTFHTGNDEVVGWTRDSQNVIFRSARGDGAFPSVATLYQIAATGGQEKPLPVDWGYSGSFSPDGTSLVFDRHPRSERQELHETTRRRTVQPLLADVGLGQLHLLRCRSLAERSQRRPGQP